MAQRFDEKVAAEEFQVWTLAVNADHSVVLICEDGNGNTVLSKAIEFTDFPPEGVTLWFTNNTIYLPSCRRKIEISPSVQVEMTLAAGQCLQTALVPPARARAAGC